MFVNVHKDDKWGVCSGVVDGVEALIASSASSLERIVQHEFVGDTKDGGLAVCLASVDGRAIPLYLQGPDGALVKDSTRELLARVEGNSDATTKGEVDEAAVMFGNPRGLRAGCHCGGVNFRITRPNALSKQCSSPWPDLLVPYHSSSSENQADIKWWLRANDSKYLAGTCACRSCRLGSGFPIQAWAFVPKANILQLDGKPLDYNMGTLKQIESSKGCFREFCSRCGATVFWHCLERPDLVDVSVGLLRASEGSRATTMLDWWTERVSFREEAFDKLLIDNLEKGLQAIKLADDRASAAS
ncbi:uncharacterized protein Z520_03269 [Fonsecaea multimorphosa CBS 102226]|uniref:CENP-V/GFA domain-containing protein n=1 Tax=Fonsecaea multimorphosa CBS 102226 TaxID=1442371 RepID=A0A0D2HF95_9EURO|nr:uncharacterized protein Z520_03269 [Fonsecaea multimorphosa CBS 102226]KIY00606.1 hypothetical protein Z520_03269 [Fonsecaea multimorphosa CBS 102226]OAL18997.1 hypothetical protein AYO22_10326 [Fonsecaea multimorphosa]